MNVGDKVKNKWGSIGTIKQIQKNGREDIFWVRWPSVIFEYPYIESQLRKVEIINHPHTNIFK